MIPDKLPIQSYIDIHNKVVPAKCQIGDLIPKSYKQKEFVDRFNVEQPDFCQADVDFQFENFNGKRKVVSRTLHFQDGRKVVQPGSLITNHGKQYFLLGHFDGFGNFRSCPVKQIRRAVTEQFKLAKVPREESASSLSSHKVEDLSPLVEKMEESEDPNASKTVAVKEIPSDTSSVFPHSTNLSETEMVFSGNPPSTPTDGFKAARRLERSTSFDGTSNPSNSSIPRTRSHSSLEEVQKFAPAPAPATKHPEVPEYRTGPRYENLLPYPPGVNSKKKTVAVEVRPSQRSHDLHFLPAGSATKAYRKEDQKRGYMGTALLTAGIAIGIGFFIYYAKGGLPTDFSFIKTSPATQARVQLERLLAFCEKNVAECRKDPEIQKILGQVVKSLKS